MILKVTRGQHVNFYKLEQVPTDLANARMRGAKARLQNEQRDIGLGNPPSPKSEDLSEMNVQERPEGPN